jgi:NAD(P)-dependent dehydrogenase (short-subunit alcohol dehydrogenase family)
MAGKDLEDFVVVVTGASTGLGRAIAVECAQRGAAVSTMRRPMATVQSS